ESGYELLTEATGMLGRRDDAVTYARALAAARQRRLGEDAPATLAARLTCRWCWSRRARRRRPAASAGMPSTACSRAIRSSMPAS
ncbi:hypothetical protein, partial [Inquilinus limosus]|uniref:hypothetical protein n=1 Tax=Inquilinus limosus TaxID=171674 RepID=UPI001EE70646